MGIEKIATNLYLIDLKQKIEGFRNFISSWVVIGDLNFLVDVGPAATINNLISYLEELSINRLDYIFLTHIHLDHAGGIGELVEHFPEAQVVCHEKAVRHLVNPEKLWEGSKKTLNDIALQYGEIKPIPEGRIIPSEKFQGEQIRTIETPGHALHHVSYLYDKYLFAGEAGGTFHRIGDKIYLRPATPATFFLEKAVASIDKLLELGKKQICYGHFGIHNDSRKMLQKHREQLFLWEDIIAEERKTSKKEELLENCISRLLLKDIFFMPLNKLDRDIQAREIYFVKHSIQGYLGYLESL